MISIKLQIVFETTETCTIENFKGQVKFYKTGELKSLILTSEDFVDFEVYGGVKINLKHRLIKYNDIVQVLINGIKYFPAWFGEDENKYQSFNAKNKIIKWEFLK